MEFKEPNDGRDGGLIIRQYTEDMHCSHDIITDCDPDTESMEIKIRALSIRGGDYQCSEDFLTFSTDGGFYGLGDYGGGQVKVQNYVKDIKSDSIREKPAFYLTSLPSGQPVRS